MWKAAKLQFRLGTALSGVAVAGLWLGSLRWGYEGTVTLYLLRFLLVVTVCHVAYHRGKTQAFWLGFTVVFAPHLIVTGQQSSFPLFFDLSEWWTTVTLHPKLFGSVAVFAYPPTESPSANDTGKLFGSRAFVMSFHYLSWTAFVLTLSTIAGFLSAGVYGRIRQEQ